MSSLHHKLPSVNQYWCKQKRKDELSPSLLLSLLWTKLFKSLWSNLLICSSNHTFCLVTNDDSTEKLVFLQICTVRHPGFCVRFDKGNTSIDILTEVFSSFNSQDWGRQWPDPSSRWSWGFSWADWRKRKSNQTTWGTSSTPASYQFLYSSHIMYNYFW